MGETVIESNVVADAQPRETRHWAILAMIVLILSDLRLYATCNLGLPSYQNLG